MLINPLPLLKWLARHCNLHMAAILIMIWFYLLPLYFHFREEKYEISFDSMKGFGYLVLFIYLLFIAMTFLTKSYALQRDQTLSRKLICGSLSTTLAIAFVLFTPTTFKPSFVWLYSQIPVFMAEVSDQDTTYKIWLLGDSSEYSNEGRYREFLVFDKSGKILSTPRRAYVKNIKGHFYFWRGTATRQWPNA